MASTFSVLGVSATGNAHGASAFYVFARYRLLIANSPVICGGGGICR
jgi:hypothetical protein